MDAPTGSPFASARADAVELEGEVGERLADAVVEVAGDAGALLVGADGAEAGEPAGVVDRQAGRLHEPVEQLVVAVGEVARLAVLEHEHPDDRLAGREDGVHARAAGRQQPGAVAEVGHVHEPALQQRGPHRLRQLEVVDAVGRAGALPADDLPAAARVVVQQQGGGVEPEQVAHPLHRRVEHLVEVERGGQALGDAVEGEEQRVGVGQAAEPVEGERVLPVGLAGDPPGVAGDEGDEQELAGPLDARAQVVEGVALAREVGDRDGQRRHRADAHREAEAPGEAGHHDRGEQREDERRVPVAGGDDREDVDGHLADDPQQARRVVVDPQRADHAEDVVGDQRDAPQHRRAVAVAELARRQGDRHRGGAAADAEDGGAEGGDLVAPRGPDSSARVSGRDRVRTTRRPARERRAPPWGPRIPAEASPQEVRRNVVGCSTASPRFPGL